MPNQKEIFIDKTNYKLIYNIGNGGSGIVWRTQSNGEEFAIKIINSKSSSKKERFQKEIEFCIYNKHKNIINIIAQGEVDGKPCYVMPLYPKTLKDIINEERVPSTLIGYILQLCNALKYIHSRDIYHRDIKPENILVKDKKLVLADFGIAHFKESRLTSKGNLLANRNYAAPEQKKKNYAKNIDSAADIFALGLIINECFTNSLATGSDFKLIADSHPLYFELDNLVSNMIKQDPSERLKIDTVITELRFIHNKIKKSLKEITTNLKNQIQLNSIKKTLLNPILQRASEDILFGKILFNSKSVNDLNKYNPNWHMKIGYKVDDFLFNLYIQEQILALCQGKFEYESNIYSKDSWHTPLDIEGYQQHKILYNRINQILSKYKFKKKGELIFDLTGIILKYYSSCADYHCIEILESIEQEEQLARTNLKNAPIIWIVKHLKSGIIHNIKYLSDQSYGVNKWFKFAFENHIKISLERIQTHFDNDDDLELLDYYYKDEEIQIQEILSELQRKWKVICTRIDTNNVSIKFKTYNQFEKFRKYALEISKPYYIFEGDVLNILDNPNFIDNMVELKLGRRFDIPDTIAKIVGMQKIM